MSSTTKTWLLYYYVKLSEVWFKKYRVDWLQDRQWQDDRCLYLQWLQTYVGAGALVPLVTAFPFKLIFFVRHLRKRFVCLKK